MRKTVKPTSVKYVENFTFDLTSKDALSCDGVSVLGNALRGLPAYAQCVKRSNFMGLIGNAGDCCFLHTLRGITQYNLTYGTLSDTELVNVDRPIAYYTIYRHKAYVIFPQYGMFRCQGKIYYLMVEKPLISVAAAGERIVVLCQDGLNVYFGDCGEEKVSLAGSRTSPSLTLETECQALHSLGNDTIYALGPTCYKITMSGNLADVKVQRIAYGLSDVVGHTVATVGNSIVFATLNGLYQLKNDKVTRIFGNLENVVKSYDGCRAGVWRDYYALSIPCEDSRKALVLDIAKQECLGVLYDGLKDVKFFNNKHYMVFNDGTLNIEQKAPYHPARFVRSAVDFGVNECKYLRRLNISTKRDVDVYVTDDRRTRRFHVKGGKTTRSVPVSGQGRSFTIEVRSKGEMEITRLELVADIYKEAYYGNQ